MLGPTSWRRNSGTKQHKLRYPFSSLTSCRIIVLARMYYKLELEPAEDARRRFSYSHSLLLFHQWIANRLETWRLLAGPSALAKEEAFFPQAHVGRAVDAAKTGFLNMTHCPHRSIRIIRASPRIRSEPDRKST